MSVSVSPMSTTVPMSMSAFASMSTLFQPYTQNLPHGAAFRLSSFLCAKSSPQAGHFESRDVIWSSPLLMPAPTVCWGSPPQAPGADRKLQTLAFEGAVATLMSPVCPQEEVPTAAKLERHAETSSVVATVMTSFGSSSLFTMCRRDLRGYRVHSSWPLASSLGHGSDSLDALHSETSPCSLKDSTRLDVIQTDVSLRQIRGPGKNQKVDPRGRTLGNLAPSRMTPAN